jgi:hypothetical protein
MSRTRKLVLVLAALLIAEALTLYAYSLLWFRSVQPGVTVGPGLNALAWICIAAVPLELLAACYLVYRLYRISPRQ